MELRNQLGESFGTKKAKKALEAATLNAVKSQGSKDGTPKALTAADRALIENIKQSSQGRATQEELQAIADEAKPIPKINTAAESIHDVYDPVAILGSEVLTAIPVHDWLEAVRNGQTLQFQSTFVANRICRVALAAKDTTRLRVLRYLFFMILIVRYAKPGRVRGTLNIPPRKILQQLCQPAPDLVIDDLRTRFARDDVMLKVHMDLLATHCAAFSLIVDNYESDVRDLTFDLKLEPAKMRQYFYEIGVRIKTVSAGEKGAQRSIAKLTLPLTFPKLRRGPGQKRR